MEIQGQALRCPHCGAPLDVSPDDVITVCKYCGQIVSLREEAKEASVVKALPKGEVERRVYDKLKKKGLQPLPEKGEIVYLPFYLFDGKAYGTVVVEIRTRDRTITKELDYKRDVRAVVYGRYGEFFGLEDIMDRVEKRIDKVEKGDLRTEDAQFIRILGTQKGLEEAEEEGRERAEFNASPIRAKGFLGALGASLTGIRFYDAHTEVAYRGLYFFPVFLYTWKEGRRRFVTIADATDGEIIVTKLPIPPTVRTAAMVGAIAMPLLVPALAQIAGLWAATIILAAAGYFLASFATRGDIVWKELI